MHSGLASRGRPRCPRGAGRQALASLINPLCCAPLFSGGRFESINLREELLARSFNSMQAGAQAGLGSGLPPGYLPPEAYALGAYSQGAELWCWQGGCIFGWAGSPHGLHACQVAWMAMQAALSSSHGLLAPRAGAGPGGYINLYNAGAAGLAGGGPPPPHSAQADAAALYGLGFPGAQLGLPNAPGAGGPHGPGGNPMSQGFMYQAPQDLQQAWRQMVLYAQVRGQGQSWGSVCSLRPQMPLSGERCSRLLLGMQFVWERRACRGFNCTVTWLVTRH